MVTPSNLPANIEAFIQDQILSWMRQEQQQTLVSLQNIHGDLLMKIRSIKEVQEWQRSLPTVISQVPMNDITLVSYVTSYVVQFCEQNNLLHSIPLVTKKPA